MKSPISTVDRLLCRRVRASPRCGCGTAGSSRRAGDLQRPARTDDGGARAGLRTRDRDQDRSSLRRRGDARQPDRAGGRQLARRRLLLRELAGPRSAGRERVPGARRPIDAGPGPERASSSAHGLWVGVAARVSALVYNPRSSAARGAAPAPDRTRPSRATARDVGFAPSETDFQPLVTAMIQHYGLAAHRSWLRGAAGTRGGLPGQRDASRSRSTTASPRSGRSTTTTCTACGRACRGETHSAICVLRAGRRRQPRRHLRRGRPAIREPPGRRRSASWRFS